MRTVMVFVTGLAIGLAVNTGFAQSDRLPGVNNMNHVAIAVDNFEEAFTFTRRRWASVKGSPSRTIRGSPRWPTSSRAAIRSSRSFLPTRIGVRVSTTSGCTSPI